jgi:hypothetical protein
MQDEELDKLINDAANQHHPAYSDTSWAKMEQLLDKHLPQKKDRKKFIFWMFLFLLAGGGVIIGIVQPWIKAGTPTNTAENINKNKPVNAAVTVIAGDNTAAVTDAAANNSLSKQNSGAIIKTSSADKGNDAVANNTAPYPLTTQKNGTIAQSAAENSNKKTIAPEKQITSSAYIIQAGNSKRFGHKRKGRYSVKIKKPAPDTEDDVVIQKADPLNDSGTNNTSPLSDKEKQNDVIANEIAADKKNDIAVKTDTANKVSEIKEKNELVKKAPVQETKRKDKSFASNFAVALSAGADVSYISINNTGKLKSFYGAGVRYNLGNHFTVSSGLYVSRKIYTAAPNQYKFPTGGSTRPNLVQINADCKIYEIPISVYYNFKPVKNHNWFSGIGISSFIMKKESYDYQYKTPTGQTWNYVKQVSNENEHYFSVLTLSGGYQYKINNRISFIAEPYIKLPLKGIGYGAIKLNSAGLLFTAAVKLFTKKK